MPGLKLSPELTSKALKISYLCLFFFFAALGSKDLRAQFQPQPCKDEALADPFYRCGGVFRPVCACDNITYHNECAAFRNAGIQGNQWVSGVCQEFFYYLYPVPAYNMLTVHLQFQSSGGRATLMLTDIFGKVVHQQFIQAGNSFPLLYQLDVSGFTSGFYVVTLYSNNYRQTQTISIIKQ
jgi:hypothetical protein